MPYNAKMARSIGLTETESALFKTLSTPEAIQDFLTAMPINQEYGGDTCQSVRSVLQNNHCHCIEAAFVAACALMLHGKPALLMDLVAPGDDDHIVTLFKRGGCWGAISKSNHIWLRWRDPVYNSPRELAMSYFHEYVKDGRKTLRSFSEPFNIGEFHERQWVTNEDDCWDVESELFDIKHYPLVTARQARLLRKRDEFEAKAGLLREFV
jgi:hypothetical protein